MNDWKWMNWNGWIEMKELKWMTWHERIERNAMNWNERIETKNLTWMNWNEWIDMNELQWMNWKEWIAKSVPNPLSFTIFIWNRALATVSRTFCRPHCPEVVWDSQFYFSILCDQLLDNDVVDIWNRALATVSCALCRPHRHKVVRDRQFLFTFFHWNRALATVSCTFCRPLSGSRRATAKTETFQRRPRMATLPEKNAGFCDQECFSREFTRSRSLILDDDMIDMMMWLIWWLRWWCACHGGETASRWQSSVTRKFPN